MSKRLSIVWIIQGVLIVLLVGSLSQLAIVLYRCSSIKAVKYQRPAVNYGRDIPVGRIPTVLRFNGITYETINEMISDKKVLELHYKSIENVIGESEDDEPLRLSTIYKIDGINQEVAVAILVNREFNFYMRYINRDYIWFRQRTKIIILSSLVLVFIGALRLIKKFTRKKIYTKNYYIKSSQS